MRSKKLYTVLAAVMAVSILGGCGATPENSAENKETTGNSAADETTDKDREQPADSDSSFEVATVRWSDWGEYYHEGFPDQAAAQLGITINWNTILNADWSDRKAVLLAGGNLPDAFMGSICFSASEVMANKDSFLILDDYIEQYMPNLSAIMKSDPTMRSMAVSADGHIYGLPGKQPCMPVVMNQLFINQTWLDNLGLEVPTTYLEFENVLKAFKEQDANGNGDPTDEIPYEGGYENAIMLFCLPYGTTLNGNSYNMTIKDGRPVYIPAYEGYKEGLKWMHECYAAGLIDQEIFTQDDSMRTAKLTSETPIVGVAGGWTADSVFGANSDQYVALPPLEGPDGNRYICSNKLQGITRYEFLVTKACKDPGRLLSWIDMFYTEDASIQNMYGSFGIATQKNDDGTYTVLEPIDGNSADTNAWIYSLRSFGPKYVPDGFNDKVIFETENGDAAKLELDKEVRQYAQEGFPSVSYQPEQLQTLSTLYTDISTYVSTMQAEWVVNGGVEEGWDEYMATLEKMGYNDFLDIMNAVYDTYMENQ